MKYSPELAQANDAGGLEIFYAKARRISLRHTLG
ncbi:unknown [Bacteroides sp. CAG:927]|nr:unknown [Bacteroides sp. CAG:927]